MVEVVESQSVGDTPQPRPHIHLVSDRSERDSFNKKKNFEFQLFFDSTNKTKQCQSNRHSIAGSVGYAGTCTTSSSHLDKKQPFQFIIVNNNRLVRDSDTDPATSCGPINRYVTILFDFLFAPSRYLEEPAAPAFSPLVRSRLECRRFGLCAPSLKQHTDAHARRQTFFMNHLQVWRVLFYDWLAVKRLNAPACALLAPSNGTLIGNQSQAQGVGNGGGFGWDAAMVTNRPPI